MEDRVFHAASLINLPSRRRSGHVIGRGRRGSQVPRPLVLPLVLADVNGQGDDDDEEERENDAEDGDHGQLVHGKNGSGTRRGRANSGAHFAGEFNHDRCRSSSRRRTGVFGDDHDMGFGAVQETGTTKNLELFAAVTRNRAYEHFTSCLR